MRNLILSLLCFPLFAFGQITFKLGASAGAVYAYRQLTVSDNSSNGSLVKQSRSQETPDWGSLYSLNCLFSKKKWLFETGIVYSNSGYKYSNNNPILGDEINDQYGFVQNPSSPKLSSFELEYRYRSIRIPVLLGYTFNVSKNQLHQIIPQLGFSNNLFINLQTDQILRYADGSHSSKSTTFKGESFNTYSVSAICGITYMYTLKKLSVSGSVLFNQSLTPVVSGSALSEYEYWGAAKIGLFYTLK